MVAGRDAGGALRADPLELRVDFPVVQTRTDAGLRDAGHGVGLDLGAAWSAGRLRAGVAVENVVNTFAWNAERFQYRPGGALFTRDSSGADFEARPLADAPAELRAALDASRFEPAVAVGIAAQVSPSLLVSADVRQRMGDGLAFAPKSHAGVGVEYRALRALPLRAGAATFSGGSQLGGGVGLELGALRLDGALARRATEAGAHLVYGVTLGVGR
jgi:hypothetical protein